MRVDSQTFCLGPLGITPTDTKLNWFYNGLPFIYYSLRQKHWGDDNVHAELRYVRKSHLERMPVNHALITNGEVEEYLNIIIESRKLFNK